MLILMITLIYTLCVCVCVYIYVYIYIYIKPLAIFNRWKTESLRDFTNLTREPGFESGTLPSEPEQPDFTMASTL